MTLQAGTRLGHYEVVALLGEGGMGQVYRARDLRLGREVALKVLTDAWAHDPARVARFTREARLLASLNHPHIATVHGIEDSVGIAALVMELVDGETLAHRLSRRSGPLPVREALMIARQAVEALEAAYDKGIVHRDLKPANIMVTRAGVVKVLDFGLAKSTSDLPASQLTTTLGALTQPGIVLGTAAYMSPEQARGLETEKPADVWALGCVVFETLAGHPAFTGQTASDILVAILDREPRWQDLPADVPQPVLRVLHRCLEKDPARRFLDAAAARMALEDGLSDETVTSSRRSSRAARRKSWLLRGSAAGVALVIPVAVWSLLMSRDTTERVAPVEVVARQLTNYGRLEDNAALSPDGRTFAFVSAHAGTSDIWIRQISGGTPVRLTNDAVPEFDLAFAPDGDRIYFSRAEAGAESIWRIGVLGGAAQRLVPGAHGAVPSPDGRRLAFVALDRAGSELLKISDADGANQRVIAKNVPTFPRVRPAWSTDGTRISYVRAGLFAPRNLLVVDLETGQERQVTRFTRPLQGVGMHVWLPGDTEMAVAFSAYSRTQTEDDLGILSLADGSIRRIATTVGQVFGMPSVSADGSRLIATATTNVREIWKFPITDANPDVNGSRGVLLVQNSQQPMWSFVARDARTLLFNGTAGGSGNLWIGPLDGSTAFRQITSVEEDAVGHLSLSPDGARVAFVSFAGGASDIWIQNVDGSGLRQVTNDAAADSWPVWSPDGTRIVYASAAASGLVTTRILGLNGGSETLADSFFRGDWIRDPSAPGTLLLTYTSTGTIRPMAPESRRVLWEETIPGTAFALPMFSADASRFSVPAAEGRGAVVLVFDRQTGQRRVAVRLPFNVIFRANWVDGDRAVVVNRFETSSHVVMFDKLTEPRLAGP
jgi:serine/threonine protein kinase